jgi:hypothetical protein
MIFQRNCAGVIYSNQNRKGHDVFRTMITSAEFADTDVLPTMHKIVEVDCNAKVRAAAHTAIMDLSRYLDLLIEIRRRLE